MNNLLWEPHKDSPGGAAFFPELRHSPNGQTYRWVAYACHPAGASWYWHVNGQPGVVNTRRGTASTERVAMKQMRAAVRHLFRFDPFPLGGG